MAGLIVRRILVNIGVFLLITIGLFALIHAAPGDPVRMMIPPDDLTSGSAAFIAHERHILGLDQPLPVQYVVWLRNAVTGNLGNSFVNGEPVTTVLAQRIGPTVELMGTALLLSLVIGLPLGIVSAVRRHSAADHAIAGVTLGALSVPPFFLGILAIYVFALKLHVLPSAGMTTPGVVSPADQFRHLIMPAVVLGLAASAPIVRYVRTGMIGELVQDYVRTAQAKGATATRVVVRHAFRNSLNPLITVVSLSIPGLLAGAVVVEQVFAWPGMGQLAVSSVGQDDYPVIIGFSLYVAVLVLICNLLADILYAVADPRVRAQ